jgi:cytoplasmic iron level regulating protein YaaA (DUF328/UPF0246 family)
VISTSSLREIHADHHIREQIATAGRLKEFDRGGYNFSSENSTATEWIFSKKNEFYER